MCRCVLLSLEEVTVCFTASPQDDRPSLWLCILSGLFVSGCARCLGAYLAGGFPTDTSKSSELCCDDSLFVEFTLLVAAPTMASLVLNETGMEDCGIDDSFKYNLYSVVYSVVFVLGLITNCAALFVFCFRMKMRNETTMFMTNLALSDLVFVFTLPFKVFYNVNQHWPFGDGLCKVSGTAFITNIYGSMLFLTCISVDRFLAIVYPFRSRSIRTRRNAALVCAAVWLTIVGGGISVTFFSTINSTTRATTCFEGFSKKTWKTYLSKITIFIEVSDKSNCSKFAHPVFHLVPFCGFDLFHRLWDSFSPYWPTWYVPRLYCEH